MSAIVPNSSANTFTKYASGDSTRTSRCSVPRSMATRRISSTTNHIPRLLPAETAALAGRLRIASTSNDPGRQRKIDGAGF